MKKVMVIVTLLFAFSACSSGSEYSDADYFVAQTAFNAWDDPDEMCDVIWRFDKQYLKDELVQAYKNGKPDGDVWVNVGISPDVSQLRALVDIQYDYCRRD